MASAIIAGLITAAGALATEAIVAAAFLKTWAVFTVLAAVSQALAPKPSFGETISGTTVMSREATPSRKVVYGRTRVGGSIAYLDGTGTDNEFLHIVLLVSARKIDAYEAMYFNEEKVWENGSFIGTWGSYVTLSTNDGTQTTADSSLESASTDWTSTSVLNGIAYAYVRLKQSNEKFPRGLPNISFVVRGKPVYDPQKDSTSAYYDNSLGVDTHRLNDETTWEWSQNPALIEADYIADAKYGLGESYASINAASLDLAQTVCDELVTLTNNTTQTKYSLDGVVDTANTRRDNIEAMLSATNGRIVPSGGEYFISAADYVAPTVTIDESMLVGAVSTQTKNSMSNLFNAVKGVYLSSEENYVATDYPPVISSSYAVEDGEPLYLELGLAYTTNNVRAQQLAKMSLSESRQQISVTLPMNMSGLLLKAGDTFYLNNERFGWNQKVFQVLNYDFEVSNSGELVVSLNCIETESSIYDWSVSDQSAYVPAPSIDLPTPTGTIQYSDLAHDAIILTSSTTLEVGKNYHVSVSGLTLTLPSAAQGDTIIVSVAGFANTQIDPNGAKVLGETDTRIVNQPNRGFTLNYTGSAYGWAVT
jgi:hypothetical protein